MAESEKPAEKKRGAGFVLPRNVMDVYLTLTVGKKAVFSSVSDSSNTIHLEKNDDESVDVNFGGPNEGIFRLDSLQVDDNEENALKIKFEYLEDEPTVVSAEDFEAGEKFCDGIVRVKERDEEEEEKEKEQNGETQKKDAEEGDDKTIENGEEEPVKEKTVIVQVVGKPLCIKQSKDKDQGEAEEAGQGDGGGQEKGESEGSTGADPSTEQAEQLMMIASDVHSSERIECSLCGFISKCSRALIHFVQDHVQEGDLGANRRRSRRVSKKKSAGGRRSSRGRQVLRNWRYLEYSSGEEVDADDTEDFTPPAAKRGRGRGRGRPRKSDVMKAEEDLDGLEEEEEEDEDEIDEEDENGEKRVLRYRRKRKVARKRLSELDEPQGDPRPCPICSEECKSGSALFYHLTKKHRGHEDFQKHFKETSQFVKKQCPLCGKILHNSSYLKEHLEHQHKEHDMKHACEECGKIYKREDLLKNHIMKVHTDRRFKCDKCGREYKDRGSLTDHKKIYHTFQSKFQCHICNKYVSSGKILKRHIQVMHDDTTPSFKCPQCDRVCNDHHNLQRHIRLIHNPESVKKVQCPVCNKIFSQVGNLNQHLQNVHHVDIHNEIYLCKVCDRSFNRKTYLYNHMRTHPGKEDEWEIEPAKLTVEDVVNQPELAQPSQPRGRTSMLRRQAEPKKMEQRIELPMGTPIGTISGEQIQQFMSQAEAGDPTSLEQLSEAIYALASQSGVTLQPGAEVRLVCVKKSGSDGATTTAEIVQSQIIEQQVDEQALQEMVIHQPQEVMTEAHEIMQQHEILQQQQEQEVLQQQQQEVMQQAQELVQQVQDVLEPTQVAVQPDQQIIQIHLEPQ